MPGDTTLGARTRHSNTENQNIASSAVSSMGVTTVSVRVTGSSNSLDIVEDCCSGRVFTSRDDISEGLWRWMDLVLGVGIKVGFD